ncbi:hypothetical protein BN1012_Phect2585 [Candidatus Phaeomarinobacter ectocarpi]|uniref:Uncharacterized protein n=1 Tax=Candidatus Phaeomarinibacter ectocarpi TaxID=1458461 RepID=X5MAF2_9HYPH|nr:hypothetical protein BN1012_Phect2585 [Candidatus Phaeomarinobacter ectocarpi]
MSDLSEPAGWFFWGLVAAVVANITIYFNYLSLMQVMRQVTEHANAKLKFAYYGEGLKPDQKVPTTPFDSIERFTFFVALAVVIASFLFFYWGADTLMEAIKTVYDDPDLKLPIPSSRPN